MRPQRVAVGEPDFFATVEHPARRLIDRMGACVMGFDSGSRAVGDLLEKEIKRVVQVVEAYPDTGRRVFQTVLTEFEKFLEHYFKNENEATRRGVSLAAQVEQRETLAIQYTIELRKMLNDVPVQDGSPGLLGIAFNPVTSELLVADAGAGVVRRVDPLNGASSVFMTATGTAALNGLAFDAAGNLYVTDSRQGIVWVVGPGGGAGQVWVQDALLTTAGVPAFGANGIGFNRDFSAAFVANTGNDTIVRVPVAAGQAGTPAVFTNSVNGADGLVLDGEDNIWVAANQADEVVVIDPTGKAIAKLGDFNGVRDGAVRGLLFPATPALSADGRFVYVTNFARDLRMGGGTQSVVSQYAAQVTRHTVARISTRFRPVADGPRRGGRGE